MSLFHDLLKVGPIRDAALDGRGFFVTPMDIYKMIVGHRVVQDKKASNAWQHDDGLTQCLPRRWTLVGRKVVDLDRVASGPMGKAHPGGSAVLRQVEGRDATVLFHSVHALARDDVLAQWIRLCTVGLVDDFPDLLEKIRTDRGLAATFNEDSFVSLSPFAQEVRMRVREYFSAQATAQGVSMREAMKAPTAKWCLVVVLWVAFVIVFLSWLCGQWFGLLLLPIIGSLATFHTFHDASHGAFSSRAWVNELLTFLGFLISSPTEWRWQHIIGHHSFTNIKGLDPDSKHTSRWVDADEHTRPSMKLVLVVWGLAVPVGLHVLGTCRLIARSLCLHREEGTGPPPPLVFSSLMASIVHRLVFYALPFYRFGFLWGSLWVVYPSVVFSFIFMLNTQLAHLNDETEGETSTRHSDCWYTHQAATTADFAPGSRLHWFMSGGLNLQVEHHLFPTVDHWHLPALRSIVEHTCTKYGLPLYTFDGYLCGLRSHIRHLSCEPSDAAQRAGTAGAGVGGNDAAATATIMSGDVGAAVAGSRNAPCGTEPSKSSPIAGSTTSSSGGASLGNAQHRQRVCIVGSGIAGNGAAYFLRDSCDVTLCESQGRVGGHAYTTSAGPQHNVDIGFQVFNYSNYPLLSRLFDELGVESVLSDMSLSVGARGLGDGRDYEWSSCAVFPTWRSFFVPSTWCRLFEILRFEALARAAMAKDGDAGLGEIALGQWIDAQGLSHRLRDEYVVPMSAALWSCPTEQILDFPAVTVLGFLENHFMLQRSRPKWRTPKHRSQDYVNKLHAELRRAGAVIRAPLEVARLEVVEGGVKVFDVAGCLVDPRPFDSVVLAVHADQSAAILRRSTLPMQDLVHMEATIGGFKYFPNKCCLHRDPRLMPANRARWSAWNVMQAHGAIAVTYWINKLQPQAVPENEDWFLTLNPPGGSVDADKEMQTFTLDHPVLDLAALRAQRGLADLQGMGGGRIFLCGAWAGHGFHEDGLRSALDACSAMGADVSGWQAARVPLQSLSMLGKLFLTRAFIPGLHTMIQRGNLCLVFSDGQEAVFGDGSGQRVEVRVHSETSLWRMLLDPGMGLADAFEKGEIDVRPDIGDLLRLFLLNKKSDPRESPLTWSPMRLITPMAKMYYSLRHSMRVNSLSGSKRNIQAHYDLSNSRFSKFLSADMAYSSGIFDEEVEVLHAQGPPVVGIQDFLELAQHKQMDRMLDLIELQDGDCVLEIGCGWGSMAIRAVERCSSIKSWTAITLSEEQRRLAEERIAERGFTDRIHVVICDYRDIASTFGIGSFSKVVSCEMVEAVGHEFLPQYFAAIDECLEPGGRVAIQAICVPDERYASYIRGSDFIRERIFPGSSLVSLGEIRRVCQREHVSLEEAAPPFSVGRSYAKTLHEWRRRFSEHEKSIRAEVSTLGVGFDDKLLRRWHYYFAYCEVGFECGHIDDWQICLRKQKHV